MRICPITYEEISDAETYSTRGLRLLAPQLKQLADLPFSAEAQRQEAIALAGKMSVQGVQTKLSAQLRIKEGRFEIVDQNGHFILKPQSAIYPELPQNEAITMSLAKIIKLDVPLHGLVYSKDKSLTYFIKRFDRIGHNKKLALEDFAQLSGKRRDTKYNSSMEKVIEVIEQYCTFPAIEFVKLFKLTLFNFLIGNEDMHLKNFSLITKDQKTTLAPAYDLLNTTIAVGKDAEELALPLNGKKKNLTRNDFFKYFAVTRLNLNEKVIEEVVQEIRDAIPIWQEMINKSFLSPKMKTRYLNLLSQRQARLNL